MDTKQIIAAHAKRLGLKPEQLSEALISHAADELHAWATEEEQADPGCVWLTGDVPDWLEPYLEQLRPAVAPAAQRGF